MLDQAFHRSLLTAEEDKLKSQFYLLLSSADWKSNRLHLPEQLAEPRFSTPNSGLYARIVDGKNKRLWQSISSQLLEWPPLPDTPLDPGEDEFTTIESKQGNYFYYHFDIAWVDDKDRETPLRISLLQDQASFNFTQSHYRQLLWRWLSALSVMLIISLWLLMRWGLRPLRTLATELKDIQTGKKQQLAEFYPQEILPVTQNLNQLLNSERQQQDRYRNTLADLAHSLKTPLAVMRGHLNDRPETTPNNPKFNTNNKHINEQIQRMDNIIQHQLQRAVNRQHLSAIAQQTAVLSILRRLQKTLDKVYADKSVTSELIGDETQCCRYSEADLLEMCGNLFDNSYKYCVQKVIVTVATSATDICISFDDDGKGVATDQRQNVLKRGERADTATIGQGIGLAVVTDMLSTLNGGLSIESSPLGGARVTMVLPR